MDRIAISVNVYHICIVSTGYMQKCCNFFPLFLCVINHVNCHFFLSSSSGKHPVIEQEINPMILLQHIERQVIHLSVNIKKSNT